MILQPPPTPRELQELNLAIKNHIEREDFFNNIAWYNAWGSYLIGLRRSYQHQWLTEAYNENSSRT